jgi:methionyl aminopeptidase
MPIVIKSRPEIERMRRAGQLGYQILNAMHKAAQPGVTTQALDDLARDLLQAAGAKAGSKNYPTYRPGEGFPGYTCISVNEEVVHGIPGPRVVNDGDLLKLDLALSLDGYCADTAITVPVGQISAPLQRLLDVTRKTLDIALANLKPGKKWSDVARLMQFHVENNGYNVVREFVGHGIGRDMHEEPKIPNFVTAEQLGGDFTLRRGMTLAVEPMVVAGKRAVDLYKDGWTVFTVDHLPAAHFEHTVAITDSGADVLTDGRVPADAPADPKPAAKA